VARILRALVLIAVLVQMGVVSTGAGGCLDSCPDDDASGQCAPLCNCSTCGHPNFRSSITSAVELVTVPPCVRLAAPSLVAPVLSPVVVQILHVPKTLLV
jgi:hypothetical protein